MKKRVISILICICAICMSIFSFKTSAANYSFTDIASNWAKADILYCCNTKEVMTGTSSTLFSPATNSKRHEIITTLAKVRGVGQRNISTGFTDVSSNMSYSGYVKWAVDKGITAGTSSTTFSPNANVTRQDLCTFIYRLCNTYSLSLPKTYAEKTFTDSSSISSYAKPAVVALQRAGLISGYSNGSFLPKNNIRRDEFAKIISSLYKLANGKMISAQTKTASIDYGAAIAVVEGGWHAFTIKGRFTENFTIEASNAEYYRRTYWGSINQGNVNVADVSFSCSAIAPQHYTSNGVFLRNFSWTSEDGIFPPSNKLAVCKGNGTLVTYSRATTSKSSYAMSVFTQAAVNPYHEIINISLNVPAYYN